MALTIPPRLVKLSRTLHIYISMFALFGMLLFSISGFMLNHPDWFELAEPHVTHRQLQLPVELLVVPIDQLKIAEHLRAAEHLRGTVTSFNDEENEIRVEFKSPGRSAEAVIQKPSGSTDIALTANGLVGVLEDLHKGDNTGDTWKRVIDTVAITLFLAALTGLILLLALPKRRNLGLTAAVFGLLIGGAIYVFWIA